MAQLNNFLTLDDLLDAIVLENLCTTMYCSTCGAFFFRQKVADFLAGKMLTGRLKVSGNTGNHRLNESQMRALAKELRTVTRGAICLVRPWLTRAREQAIRFLIREVWNNAPGETREEWMRSILDGTKAGEHYEALLAHYKEDLSREAAYRERNSPEAEMKRLDEKSRLRRERLLQRVIRKAEIDHIWRAKQSGSN